jgi:hypothetical protein
MANYRAAILRPFLDWKKLIIGSLIAPLPVVNIIIMGYALRCARSFAQIPYQLPMWRPWKQLVLDGLMVYAISILAEVPVFVLFMLGSLPGIANYYTLITILVLVYLLFIGYFLPAALVIWARGRSLQLALSTCWRAAINSEYAIAWLVGSVLWVVMAGVLILVGYLLSITIVVPYLAFGAAVFAGLCMFMSLLGDVLR